MTRSLPLGQYMYKNSVVHNIDPRIKIVYVIILSIMVFLVNNFSKMLVFSLFVVIILLLTRINILNFIRRLRPFYFVLIFILLMYVIFSPNHIGQGLLAIWRFLILIFLSFILTFTTTISSLIAAIEVLIRPIKFIGFKPRNIATMVSIAVRFVPVMFLHFERQRESMVARLANFKKFKPIKLLIMNLFEKMLKSASLLADAMQSRLYNENSMSHKILKFDTYDYLSMAVVLIFIIIIY